VRSVKVLAALLVLAVSIATAADPQAKKIILFIGDAGGIPTLNAASIYGYGQPQKLFIQSMPHFALMDTSAADVWVTDSAAGMTAIVTGQKTNNGVLSQSAAAVRGKQDGEVLKTILEHAEEHGLATGVLSNMTITDATPGACYAHTNERGETGQIFAQILTPRFGDGIDVVIGAGRDTILKATEALGLKIEPALREKGYSVYDSLDAISPRDRRAVALFNTNDFSLDVAVDRALRILEQNPRGYFLMVEWDTHTDNLRRGLDQAIALDSVIRKTSEAAKDDTLIIFAADHSFDLRLMGGRRGEPILPEAATTEGATPAAKPNIRAGTAHTGEEILVAAKGPGAERVHGFIANTDLFRIMMAAFGWNSR
jgi:alkaline phosphatase